MPLVLGGVEFDHPARARRPLRRRRARARADRRAARRRGARRHRLAVPLGRGALPRRLVARRCSREAYAQVREAGWRLVNADCVLVGEEPRIAPHRDGDAPAARPRRSARARSTSARRRPTGSASPAAARASPPRPSRCSSARLTRLGKHDRAVGRERDEPVAARARRPPRRRRARRPAATARSATARRWRNEPSNGDCLPQRLEPPPARRALRGERARAAARARGRGRRVAPRSNSACAQDAVEGLAGPLLHAADVRVDRQHVPPEGEVPDRGGGVRPDAGQLGQVVGPAALGDVRARRGGG